MLNYDLRTFGIIFDISNRQINGIRVIDAIKEQLINFISNNFDDNDSLYLYHPAATEILRDIGNQVSKISNYESDYSFNLNYALKQTLYIVAAEELEVTKNICLISDRIKTEQKELIESAFFINQKEYFDCQFFVLGVGTAYRKNLVKEICEEKAAYVHTDDPKDMYSIYSGWFGGK